MLVGQNQVFDAISAAFQKMGTLMQRLGGNPGAHPLLFLLTEMADPKNHPMVVLNGTSCSSWAQSL